MLINQLCDSIFKKNEGSEPTNTFVNSLDNRFVVLGEELHVSNTMSSKLKWDLRTLTKPITCIIGIHQILSKLHTRSLLMLKFNVFQCSYSKDVGTLEFHSEFPLYLNTLF